MNYIRHVCKIITYGVGRYAPEIRPKLPDLDHTSGGIIMLPESLLHCQITHPRLVSHDRKQGVAILVFNKKGEVLLIEQRDCDLEYGRKAGDWNIITETREEGELFLGTYQRGLSEELGVKADPSKKRWDKTLFHYIPGSYRETNGRYEKDIGCYKYRCSCVIYEGDSDTDPNILFHSHDGEIMAYKWVNPKVLDVLEKDVHVEEGAKALIKEYSTMVIFNLEPVL